MELDTSQKAMEAASGDVSPPFRVGEKVRIFKSNNRSLSVPEEALILGCRLNKVWYRMLTINSHEGFDEGSAWGFYFDSEELIELERLNGSLQSLQTDCSSDGENVTFDQFVEWAFSKDTWDFEKDMELVHFVNKAMADANVGRTTNLLYKSISFSLEKKCRIGVLLFLNDLIIKCLPMISMYNSNVEDSLVDRLKRVKHYILTTTKKTFWLACIKTTTSPTTLSSEEYVDPPQIRTVGVNRVRATTAKLLQIPSCVKRMKRTVFGQLYAEMHKWSDVAFRRAYCGKGHGGQKRAFKIKLIGEGVDDYGGPYRYVMCLQLLTYSLPTIHTI